MQTNARARPRAHSHTRERTFLLIPRSRTYRAPELSRTRPRIRVRIDTYTSAVIGYRLYRVQQPYGAQTRQLGMWVTYRNRALSNPIPRSEFCVSPLRSCVLFSVFSSLPREPLPLFGCLFLPLCPLFIFSFSPLRPRSQPRFHRFDVAI